MSHIDAKAETKGVEATKASSICECGHSAAMHEWHDDVSSCCLGKVHDTGSFGLRPRACTCPGFRAALPQPQRHARINCNGKSCGKFNCNTCHPQEGELRLRSALENLLRHCDLKPQGETQFERDVITARAELASQLKAAKSSPSLPLEEPEQLVSDDELAAAIAYAMEHKSAYLPALVELQNRRALAARRGER